MLAVYSYFREVLKSWLEVCVFASSLSLGELPWRVLGRDWLFHYRTPSCQYQWTFPLGTVPLLRARVWEVRKKIENLTCVDHILLLSVACHFELCVVWPRPVSRDIIFRIREGPCLHGWVPGDPFEDFPLILVISPPPLEFSYLQFLNLFLCGRSWLAVFWLLLAHDRVEVAIFYVGCHLSVCLRTFKMLCLICFCLLLFSLWIYALFSP